MTTAPETIPKDPNERMNLFFNTITDELKIWLLVDEHGSVLLCAEDEDCVPVWPTQAHAQQWATDEWVGFTTEPISLAKWKSRWTNGLSEDDLLVVIFPDLQGEGIVLTPDEFASELSQREAKRRR